MDVSRKETTAKGIDGFSSRSRLLGRKVPVWIQLLYSLVCMIATDIREGELRIC